MSNQLHYHSPKGCKPNWNKPEGTTPVIHKLSPL